VIEVRAAVAAAVDQLPVANHPHGAPRRRRTGELREERVHLVRMRGRRGSGLHRRAGGAGREGGERDQDRAESAAARRRMEGSRRHATKGAGGESGILS